MLRSRASTASPAAESPDHASSAMMKGLPWADSGRNGMGGASSDFSTLFHLNGSCFSEPFRTGGFLDYRLGGLDAQVVQRVGGRFEHINLFRVQLVGGGFVPVGPLCVRMIGQANLLDPLAPAGPGNGTVSLHHE